MPAGEEIEASGDDILANTAVVICQCKDGTTPREKEGDGFTFELAKIYRIKRIQVPRFKKLRSAGTHYNLDGCIGGNIRSIIKVCTLEMTAIAKAGV